MKWLGKYLPGVVQSLVAAGVLYLLKFVPAIGPLLAIQVPVPLWMLLSVVISVTIVSLVIRRSSGKPRIESLHSQITTMKDEHESQVNHLHAKLKRPPILKEVPARITGNQVGILELAGKLQLLSEEARRLAEALAAIDEMAPRTHTTLTGGRGPFDRSFTSLANVSAPHASLADWQGQIARYRDTMRELNQPVNRSTNISFRDCWQILTQESQNLAQQACLLRDSVPHG